MKLLVRSLGWLPAWAGLLLAVVLISGCVSTDTARPSPPVSDPARAAANQPSAIPNATDILRPTDLVTVVFSGVPSPPERHEERIKEDGTIRLQFFDQPIVAAGKTSGQLQEEIHDLYITNKIFKRLTVTVLTENRFFFVSGEIKSPGRLLYAGELTVLKAIAAAGDFTDFAKKTRVALTRLSGQKLVINADKARKDITLDVPVYPGDKIHVPRRLW